MGVLSMRANPSRLSCRGYFVTEMTLTANPHHDPEKPLELKFSDLSIDSSTEKVGAGRETPDWRVLLRIQQKLAPDRNAPYNFSITLLGNFYVHPKYPGEKADQLVEVNGSSILYSAARQILRQAMSNGPFNPLLLPTVSFVNHSGPTEPANVDESKSDAQV